MTWTRHWWVRAMIRNSRHVILLADATKLGGQAPVRIGHLQDVSTFVTDRLAHATLRATCDAAGVTLIETDLGAGTKRTRAGA